MPSRSRVGWFNSREIATLVWAMVGVSSVLVLAVRDASVRPSMYGLARAVLSPAILLPFVGFYAFCRASCGLLSRRARVEAFFELATFQLWIELLIQPLVFVLVLMELVVGREPEHQKVASCAGRMLAVAGFIFVAATLHSALQAAGSTDWAELGRITAMLLWLPVAALPYVFIVAWCLSYGSLMRLVKWKQNEPLRWGTRLAVAAGFNIHLYQLGRARFDPAHDLARANGFRESLRVVRQFRSNLTAPESADSPLTPQIRGE